VLRLLTLLAVATAVAAAQPARAEMYRFSAPDGTLHFTNAPTDPRYQRMGFTSGTGAGWLRLPAGALGSAAYLPEIKAAADRYGVPEKLVSAVIRVESGFNPRAVSRKGARGLMQLMPATASVLGVRNTFDPEQNIDGGVRHLRGLIDRFDNNVPLALAAYNAGERAVLSHRGIPPYAETQDYVTRVLRIWDGDGEAGAATFPSATYRVVEADGTIVYTNIPPRGRK
jgi:soluble lytic murein transglycosylase-like protein